ncbi:MAG: cell wall hydrolase [Aurantimonas coralicida]|uniref:cell wall hydrolase n=1 Tax=Aurantimonas TaxID=182269 RepID=UPI000416228C|nr:cell wall hydrolase [Aurantimonas coralicida]
MMTAVEQHAGTRLQKLSKARAAKAVVLATGCFASLAMVTSPVARQDMTSLLGGSGHANQWRAYFVPSKIGTTETAAIAFAGSDLREPIPAGLKLPEGMEAVAAPRVEAAIVTPEETRIMREDKGARVLSLVPASNLPPRGFSAGSILERQSLLGSRVVGGQERIRTAFSKVTQTTKEAITVAMNFQLQGPPKIPGAKTLTPNDKIMLASLKPSAGDTNALGYAPSTGSARTSSLFETILKDTPEAFIPPIGDKDHAWAATPLPAETMSKKEQSCLANGLYFEARGESTMGQAAVAQVILNRVRNPAFPNTICGVVYQNKNWRNRCQFSFACDGARDRVSDSGSWAKAKRIAEQVTRGEIWINEVGSATHYHANYVRPRWAGAMERVDKIGKHIFYRTFNGGW